MATVTRRFPFLDVSGFLPTRFLPSSVPVMRRANGLLRPRTDRIDVFYPGAVVNGTETIYLPLADSTPATLLRLVARLGTANTGASASIAFGLSGAPIGSLSLVGGSSGAMSLSLAVAPEDVLDFTVSSVAGSPVGLWLSAWVELP